MFEKPATDDHSPMDPRVRRTRDLLGDALVELLHERPFDEITVQLVLDRAGVARSTFYQHFRDKNDLFLSDVEDFLEGFGSLLERTGEESDRLLPVRELFAHLAEVGDFYRALVASGKIRDVFDLMEGTFARSVERRLAASPRARGLPEEARAAAARAHAGALVSLIDWWVLRRDPLSPEQMDTLFHRLAWSGIGGFRIAEPMR